MQFKDFYIAIGEAGAYSANMKYQTPIGVYEKYGIMVKHAPFSLMKQIKNVVVQSWADEEGDDVYLPMSSSGKPAVTHEATEYTVTFVLYQNNGSREGHPSTPANTQIQRFVDDIEGRWLKIYDSYTGIGFDGVYLQDVDDDPRFLRRNVDLVIFDLKFMVNGKPLEAPLA